MAKKIIYWAGLTLLALIVFPVMYAFLWMMLALDLII